MRTHPPDPAPLFNLTAMIDVVFLLLVFFLFADHRQAVLTRFDALRPATPTAPAPMPPALRIGVLAQGLTLQDRALPDAEIARLLHRVATREPGAPVVLACAPEAAHAQLIRALDLCAEQHLTRVSVVTRAPARSPR